MILAGALEDGKKTDRKRKMMNKFYTHGELDCNDCFQSGSCTLDEGWKLNNNPGYGGGSKFLKEYIPDSVKQIILLGMIKGIKNQLRAISK